jgi:hypothetical protein
MDTYEERPRRLGRSESAVQAQDWESLREEIQAKCYIDPNDVDPCWVWLGARDASGYSFSGRTTTRRFVHRLVAWAVAGFPGELTDFPSVRHQYRVG